LFGICSIVSKDTTTFVFILFLYKSLLIKFRLSHFLFSFAYFTASEDISIHVISLQYFDKISVQYQVQLAISNVVSSFVKKVFAKLYLGK
jgi:hypothetical protein